MSIVEKEFKSELNLKTLFSRYLYDQSKTLSLSANDLKISIVFFSDKPSVMLFVKDKYKSNVAIDKETIEDIKDYFSILKAKYHIVFIQSMKVEFFLDVNTHINLVLTNVYKEGVLIS